MNVYLNKLINNPLLYFIKFLKYFLNIILYPFRFIFFKNISFNTYISLRSSISNHFNIELGKYTEINTNVIIWPTKLIIGNFCQINPGTAIYGKVEIGDHVMVAPNCTISGGNHNFFNNGVPMRFQGSNEKGIQINDDVWIGANTVILDGVTIGKGTIVGAGSVVTKNLEPYSIYFGNPAIYVKNRYE